MRFGCLLWGELAQIWAGRRRTLKMRSLNPLTLADIRHDLDRSNPAGSTALGIPSVTTARPGSAGARGSSPIFAPGIPSTPTGKNQILSTRQARFFIAGDELFNI